MTKDNILSPYISIILPIRNEERYIDRCLAGILKQSIPKEKYEVIVIDAKSKDKSKELLNKYTKVINIRIFDDNKGKIASGLNIGIKNALGRIIIRVDARTVLSENYIKMLLETQEETGADNVGGVQKPIADGVTQQAIGISMSSPFGVGNAQFRLGNKSGFVDTVYLGCFKREIFDRIGYFDEGNSLISEDSDMNQRIRETGGKVYLNKDIIAYYYPRESFLDFWKLYFHYGEARAGNIIKTKKLTSWRQSVPPLLIISLLLTLIGGLFSIVLIYIFISIVGLYLVLDLIISGIVSFNKKQARLLPLLFIAFPCMHFSWGSGLIIRLFTVLNQVVLRRLFNYNPQV
ncbi:MAG: hypothetical protein A2231_02410 [Candidatus Firestonebacteria bacterium RIFOXYA2_FULL_40_8]|nr:MAG: hypothetical protein A2231_02410 [Candidatus Firestonebacteria bacterium RIFOXYA2_FULL_40_8]